MENQKVYICPEHCAFFFGEDGCGHNIFDESARYELTGDYPLCPQYEDREESKGWGLPSGNIGV